MSVTGSQVAQITVQQVIAILQADLPSTLLTGLRIGDYMPGLLSHLPFVTVAATIKRVRNTGVGGTVGLKQAPIDGALVDLGYVTGMLCLGELTLTLWTITRPQLENLRNALTALAWAQRTRQWEAPSGVLNRVTFLNSQLADASVASVAPLPPAPPHFIINANNTELRNAPAANATVLGQAQQGEVFEILGRSADAIFIQGCCFQGQPIWVAAAAVAPSLALATVPVVEPPVAAPQAAPKPRRRRTPAAERAVIDPGTAILATASSSPITAWRQDFTYTIQLELTQEPVTAGDRIAEIQISQQLSADGVALHTERTRLTA